MSHTRFLPLRHAFFHRTVVIALALALSACGTRKPVTAPSADQLAAMAAALAEQEQRLTALAADTSEASPIVTRVVFNRGMYKPGIERLRVVRRQNTFNNVAAQVALNVALIALTRGGALQSFSKDDLGGDEIPELASDPVAVNPAMQDLADGLGRMATRFYARRAIEAVAVAKTDGSTPEEIAGVSQIPKDFGTALTPAGWQLVYENLAAGDDLYRLKFGAQLGRIYTGPIGCGYASEPLAWAAWQADSWQRLREERAKAVTQCTAALAAQVAANW